MIVEAFGSLRAARGVTAFIFFILTVTICAATVTVSIVVLTIFIFLTALVPARRASHVDPLLALRTE